MLKRDLIDEFQRKDRGFTVVAYRSLAKKAGIDPAQKELSEEETDRLRSIFAGEDVAPPSPTQGAMTVVSAKEARRDIAALAHASKSGAEAAIQSFREMRTAVAGELADTALEVLSPAAFNADFMQQLAQKSNAMRLSFEQVPALPADLDLSDIYDIEAEVSDA